MKVGSTDESEPEDLADEAEEQQQDILSYVLCLIHNTFWKLSALKRFFGECVDYGSPVEIREFLTKEFEPLTRSVFSV